MYLMDSELDLLLDLYCCGGLHSAEAKAVPSASVTPNAGLDEPGGLHDGFTRVSCREGIFWGLWEQECIRDNHAHKFSAHT